MLSELGYVSGTCQDLSTATTTLTTLSGHGPEPRRQVNKTISAATRANAKNPHEFESWFPR